MKKVVIIFNLKQNVKVSLYELRYLYDSKLTLLCNF